MDQVREVLRYHHYAYRTEQTYTQWILRYIFHYGGKTHPRELGAKEVRTVQPSCPRKSKMNYGTTLNALSNFIIKILRKVLERFIFQMPLPVNTQMLPEKTEIYTHVMQKDLHSAQSPLDFLATTK